MKLTLWADDELLVTTLWKQDEKIKEGVLHFKGPETERADFAEKLLQRWQEFLSSVLDVSVQNIKGSELVWQNRAIMPSQKKWVKDITHQLRDFAEIRVLELPFLWEEELPELVRLSGLPLITRKALYDKVTLEAVGQQTQLQRFIWVDLGEGTTVAAVENGILLDLHSSWSGEGPMGLAQAGNLFTLDLIHWAFQDEMDFKKAEEQILYHAGWEAWKEKMLERDWESMLAYQVGKEIGAMRAVLRGKVEGVILTGKLVARQEFLQEIVGSLPEGLSYEVYPQVDLSLGLLKVSAL